MGVDSLSVRVFWPSTHASIPSGWSRDTLWDEKFLQGVASDYVRSVNGGGSHTHTGTGHTHVGNQHRHTFEGVADESIVTQIEYGGRFPNVTSPPISFPRRHRHNVANGAYNTITYQEETVTIESEEAMPPYMKLIVIKPDAVTDDIPDDAVCYTDETVLPTGFAKFAALDDSFVRAPSVGADADLAGFGGPDHDHDSPAGSHDHDIDGHSHALTTCGQAPEQSRGEFGIPGTTVLNLQHHSVPMGPKFLDDMTETEVVVAATSSEPSYIKLLGIQNTSGDPTTPVGVIVGFVGAATTVPSNWQLCDGVGDTVDCQDKQIWSTVADGEIGDVGGSNLHTHTITGNHDHDHGGHNHPVGSVNMIGNVAKKVGVEDVDAIPQIGGIHTHPWTINGETPTLQAAAVTLDGIEDVRSAYRTLIWIKKLIERPGPKALLASTF